MTWLLLAALFVYPGLAEDGPLRMVAADADGEVVWSVDGAVVGTTVGREVLVVSAEAGQRTVRAESADTDGWRILVRPDPEVRGSASYVHGWTAVDPGSTQTSQVQSTGAKPVWPYALIAVGILLAMRPRRAPVREEPSLAARLLDMAGPKGP